MSYLRNVRGVAVVDCGSSGFVITSVSRAQLRKWFGMFGSSTSQADLQRLVSTQGGLSLSANQERGRVEIFLGDLNSGVMDQFMFRIAGRSRVEVFSNTGEQTWRRLGHGDIWENCCGCEQEAVVKDAYGRSIYYFDDTWSRITEIHDQRTCYGGTDGRIKWVGRYSSLVRFPQGSTLKDRALVLAGTLSRTFSLSNKHGLRANGFVNRMLQTEPPVAVAQVIRNEE